MDGTEGIREISKNIWNPDKYYNPDRCAPDKTYCKFSGYLDEFHAPVQALMKLGVSINRYEELNRTQKMVMHTILQSVMSANYSLEDIRDSALFVGNMLGDPIMSNYILHTYVSLYSDIANNYIEKKGTYIHNNRWMDMLATTMKDRLKIGSKLDKSLFPSSLASQIADILGLNQLSMVVDGACSGGLIVIDEAIKCLHQKKVKKCIVIGVLGNMGVSGNVAFSKIGGLSATQSKPLDKNADGLTPGEGAGTIIIKLLSDALVDGDKIYGVIRGSGVASDGAGQSIYAPSSRGQHAAMRKSLSQAEMTMKDIDYVEMHATGTSVGDKVEVRSILQLCEEDHIEKPVALGSLKAQIGHSFSGAGMANVFKVLLAMREQLLPPTYHFTSLPDEFDDVSKYIYVNAHAKYWERTNNTPRKALINAFGFGGINANVLVEEYELEYHKALISRYQSGRDEQCEDRKYVVVGYGYFEERPNDSSKRKTKTTDPGICKTNDFVFPYIKFKIPPIIYNKLDEAQRFSLLAVSAALDRAGLKLPLTKTGVFSGGIFGLKNAYTSDVRIRSVEYTDALREILGSDLREDDYHEIEEAFKSHFEEIGEDTLPGFMDNIVAGRIANYFDTQGINATYDMDIGSFGAALHQGVLSLSSKENDVIIVGATNFNDLPAFDEAYRAFGSDSKFVRKGACFFVIKRQEDTPPEEVIAYITEPQFSKRAILPYADSAFDYMGATEAFIMLENILKATEERKCINHTTASLTGRTFSYEIIPQKLDRSEEPERYNIFYTNIDEPAQLAASLEALLKSGRCNANVLEGERQVAIIYKDKKDIAKQIELLNKLQTDSSMI